MSVCVKYVFILCLLGPTSAVFLVINLVQQQPEITLTSDKPYIPCNDARSENHNIHSDEPLIGRFEEEMD